MQKKRKIQQSYDEESYVVHYDRRYRTAQFQKAVELFSMLTKNASSLNVMLDFGAGTGLLWKYFHQRNLPSPREGLPNRLVAIDLSWGMLKNFVHKLKTASDPLFSSDLICCDGEALPLRDQQFSIVVALTSLQNLPDVPRGLQEIARVMVSRGCFGLTYLRKSISKTDLALRLKQSFPHSQVDFPDREKKLADIEDWICMVNS